MLYEPALRIYMLGILLRHFDSNTPDSIIVGASTEVDSIGCFEHLVYSLADNLKLCTLRPSLCWYRIILVHVVYERKNSSPLLVTEKSTTYNILAFTRKEHTQSTTDPHTHAHDQTYAHIYRDAQRPRMRHGRWSSHCHSVDQPWSLLPINFLCTYSVAYAGDTMGFCP